MEDFKCPREHDLDELKTDVKSIMENHLPHLRQALSWIKGALWVLVPLIIAGFGILIYLLMR